jgi:hypothetical protein
MAATATPGTPQLTISSSRPSPSPWLNTAPTEGIVSAGAPPSKGGGPTANARVSSAKVSDVPHAGRPHSLTISIATREVAPIERAGEASPVGPTRGYKTSLESGTKCPYGHHVDKTTAKWTTPKRPTSDLQPDGHVGEAREVSLEGDRDGVRRSVAVLGDDEIGLAGTGVLLLVCRLAVQQDHHVGVLLE